MIKRTQRGFSLLELLIVVSIVLVIAAMATPSLLWTVRRYQLESSARNVASVLLRARSEAVRLNWRTNTIYANANPPVYGVDEEGPSPPLGPGPNGILEPAEPQLPLSTAVQVVPAGPGVPPLATMGPNYAAAVVPAGFQVAFGSVGTVIQQTSPTTWIEGTAVYVLFLQHNITGSWAAVTITPASRIRVWFWDGTNWSS